MNEPISKINDSQLGEIVFKRSLRARRLSIKILSGRLEVILPRGYSVKHGLEFLNSVREKLIRKQKLAARNSIAIRENNPLQTLTFRVEVAKADRKNLFSSLKSGVLRIEYPNFLDVNDANTQAYFWKSISYFLRKEAKRVLPDRVQFLAEKYNFTFSEVKIQASKTRWGCCNHKKTINLSLFLLILPQHLIDYVILHELCHTKEMNHGPQFWAWMDKVTDGNAKKLRSELKKYSIPK